MPDNIFTHIIQALTGLVIAMVGMLHKNLHTEVVKLRDKQGLLDNELRDHKLEAEKRYLKEGDLIIVHKRMDRMDEKLDKIYDMVKK